MAVPGAPATLHCGAELPGALAQTVTKFAEDIRKASGSAELFIYPGEAHAFMVRHAPCSNASQTGSHIVVPCCWDPACQRALCSVSAASLMNHSP